MLFVFCVLAHATIRILAGDGRLCVLAPRVGRRELTELALLIKSLAAKSVVKCCLSGDRIFML
jgi:hypothetical protein